MKPRYQAPTRVMNVIDVAPQTNPTFTELHYTVGTADELVRVLRETREWTLLRRRDLPADCTHVVLVIEIAGERVLEIKRAKEE